MLLVVLSNYGKFWHFNQKILPLLITIISSWVILTDDFSTEAQSLSHISSQFQFPVTVYYEDTDAGGVVYHSNYLNFFERGRTEMLRSRGINQRVLLEQSTGFVVRHIDIDFLRGARLDDNLMVTTTISEFKRASLTFLQEITDQHDVTIAKAVVKVACVDNSIMKPKAIPTPILTELKHSDG